MTKKRLKKRSANLNRDWIYKMLKEKLQTDVKEALKSGNAVKRMVLGLVLSSIKSRELDKRSKLSKTESDPAKLEETSKLNDEEIIEVLSSEIKKRKDSIELYEKGGRPELAEKEQSEINILVSYMPEQMSEEAIKKVVRETIKDMGKPGSESSESLREKSAKGVQSELLLPGKVIGAVMAKIKGKADGTLVSKIVKEELSK